MKIMHTIGFVYQKGLVAGTLLLLSPWAMAASSDAFTPLEELLETWATGALGKSLALIFLIVGLALGAIRGSVLGAVGAIGVALAFALGPTILTSLFPTI